MQNRQDEDFIVLDPIINAKGKPADQGTSRVPVDVRRHFRCLGNHFQFGLDFIEELASEARLLFLVPRCSFREVLDRLVSKTDP